ncbi:hypothetical protein SERLA73DRAFT_175595 [Serpula lacrymans var. lacrymans S7.3]|uniref:Cytochrome P450 n=2 Tax=Serpula lacrymans var. lacrymans TaxID=341189 RepID=F8PKV0_SERL3|nr:uncharacterized protein SERLADRAFT_458122 [Serpula lacrymans var. lacrymans S7.9]EGO03909.1 hypothetical protein SERLA73DRAFT_175595 [Serpula lacrymans var. lacrymans S7.3]EGO29831.1 hypothetical protein SERLADRAFT_458122 [Serpula lacrymans var. lacrymans S7.9]
MDSLTSVAARNQSSMILYTTGLVALSLSYALYRLLALPSHLRHLPSVPIWPIVLSYARQEPDDVRIKRLLLPYANKHSEGVVLVWVFGQWMVHILDPQLAFQVNANLRDFPKYFPPWDLLLLRFTGRKNIVTTNGDEWRKISTLIHDAFTIPVPVDVFTSLAKKLFHVIEQTTSTSGDDHKVNWADLAQRYALDAIGYSVAGYNIDAISTESQLANDYNTFMRHTADPLYLALPILEKIIPRKHVFDLMNNIKDKLADMLLAKRLDPGQDIMSFMLRDPTLTKDELRDNISTLFIAGHDTTAGALSMLIYYLAVDQISQKSAREEVIRVLGPSADPSLPLLSANALPYVSACIKEALRNNTPVSYAVPRISGKAVNLGKYYIPSGTAVITNIYGVHHNESVWKDASVFRPERFLTGEDTNQVKHSWIPFNGGPRRCPAQNFAQYELRTLASMLLREYEWTLPEDSIHANGIKNAFSPFALTVPHDLDIIFRKRT